jgi:hypothetical protein
LILFYLKLNAEMEKREHTLEASVLSLKKLKGEQTQFTDWLNELDSSLNNYASLVLKDKGHDLQALKKLCSDYESIESSIYTHQADLKFIKQSFQNYATLCDSFSNDLRNYCVRIKNHSNLNSGEQSSDLSSLKQEILVDADAQFQSVYKKFTNSKETLDKLLAAHFVLNDLCAKFEEWLADQEAKLNAELKRSMRMIGDMAANNTESTASAAANARKFDDLLKKFQAFKSEFQQYEQQNNSIDEINNSMNKIQNLLDPMTKYAKQLISSHPTNLIERFKLLDEKASSQCDYLLEQMNRSRNLKENVDSTVSWLNELNQLYLNGSAQSDQLNSNKQSDEIEPQPPIQENKIELYEQLRQELNSRKDSLLKSYNESSV